MKVRNVSGIVQSRSFRLGLLTLGLAGISVFVFGVVISPYAKTRLRLKLLKPRIEAAVAGERFLRYSMVEIKQAIDFALIDEGEDRADELQAKGIEMEHWRAEASNALAQLRSELEAGVQASNMQHMREDVSSSKVLERDHMRLAEIEQRIQDLALHLAPREQLEALIKTQFLPVADAVLSASDKLAQQQIVEMKDEISRLSGNLDGVVLYSGTQLRARAESMNATGRKEVQAGLYARLLTRGLTNFSTFLLMRNAENSSNIQHLEQEIQIIER